MKDRKDVVAEFNSLVNMTAKDLESWLKSDDSNSAGWPKDGGNDDDAGGESVGHESGRKIVEILQANPDKEPEKYTDDHVEHMRKVVSYCKRHLAQEAKTDGEKSEEELKKTKSYASLKNWGHDILKARGQQNGSSAEEGGEAGADEDSSGANGSAKSEAKSPAQPKRQTRSSAKDSKAANADEGEGSDQEGDEGHAHGSGADSEDADDEAGAKTTRSGRKRKVSNPNQNGSQKKQQMKKGRGAKAQTARQSQDENDENDDDDDGASKAHEEEMADQDEQQSEGQEQGTEARAEKHKETDSHENGDEAETETNGKDGLNKGDTVSWKWGGNHPEGKVLDVKENETSITTKNGNKVSRKGTEEDPAVVIDAGSSKAVKKAHELD